MRTFIVCLSQGGTDTFEICFNLFTPPYRDVPFECVPPWMRCDTDVPFICHIQYTIQIYVYTQMHLNILQYHTIYPPPYFFCSVIVITNPVKGRNICTYIYYILTHILLQQRHHSKGLLYSLTIPT